MIRAQSKSNVCGNRVHIRQWERYDTLVFDRWPRYSDPFNRLWNVPRSSEFEPDSLLPQSNVRRVWAIENHRRQLIGRISLREIDLQLRQARLGISLGAPYVGQGMGTEALALFLDHFFDVMDFLMMRLDVAAFNYRAIRCYEKLGFCHIDSEWRNAGYDASLRLLNDPDYREFTPFFRRNGRGTLVQFLEMEISRDQWHTRRFDERKKQSGSL